MKRVCPTHELRIGECLKIYPGKDTPVINLKEHMQLLLSKDLSRNAELDWVATGEQRFLDGESIDGNFTTFASFPRSGNTMLRAWFEKLTGVSSGTDINKI